MLCSLSGNELRFISVFHCCKEMFWIKAVRGTGLQEGLIIRNGAFTDNLEQVPMQGFCPWGSDPDIRIFLWGGGDSFPLKSV